MIWRNGLGLETDSKGCVNQSMDNVRRQSGFPRQIRRRSMPLPTELRNPPRASARAEAASEKGAAASNFTSCGGLSSKDEMVRKLLAHTGHKDKVALGWRAWCSLTITMTLNTADMDLLSAVGEWDAAEMETTE